MKLSNGKPCRCQEVKTAIENVYCWAWSCFVACPKHFLSQLYAKTIVWNPFIVSEHQFILSTAVMTYQCNNGGSALATVLTAVGDPPKLRAIKQWNVVYPKKKHATNQQKSSMNLDCMQRFSGFENVSKHPKKPCGFLCCQTNHPIPPADASGPRTSTWCLGCKQTWHTPKVAVKPLRC